MAYHPFYSSFGLPPPSTIPPPSPNPGYGYSSHYNHEQQPSLPYSQLQPPPPYSPASCFSHGYTPPSSSSNPYTPLANLYSPLASLYSQSQPPPPSSPPHPYSSPLPFHSTNTPPPNPIEPVSSCQNNVSCVGSASCSNTYYNPPDCYLNSNVYGNYTTEWNIGSYSSSSSNLYTNSFQDSNSSCSSYAANLPPTKPPESDTFTVRNGLWRVAELSFAQSLAVSPLPKPPDSSLPRDDSALSSPPLPPPSEISPLSVSVDDPFQPTSPQKPNSEPMISASIAPAKLLIPTNPREALPLSEDVVARFAMTETLAAHRAPTKTDVQFAQTTMETITSPARWRGIRITMGDKKSMNLALSPPPPTPPKPPNLVSVSFLPSPPSVPFPFRCARSPPLDSQRTHSGSSVPSSEPQSRDPTVIPCGFPTGSAISTAFNATKACHMPSSMSQASSMSKSAPPLDSIRCVLPGDCPTIFHAPLLVFGQRTNRMTPAPFDQKRVSTDQSRPFPVGSIHVPHSQPTTLRHVSSSIRRTSPQRVVIAVVGFHLFLHTREATVIHAFTNTPGPPSSIHSISHTVLSPGFHSI